MFFRRQPATPGKYVSKYNSHCNSKYGAIPFLALFFLQFCNPAFAGNSSRASEWFASPDGSTEIVQMDTRHGGNQLALLAIGVASFGGIAVSMLIWKQRRRMQQIVEQLRMTEERLKEAQAIANVGSWTRDFATGETYWSKEARELLMLEDTQKQWGHYETFVHPDDQGLVVEAIAKAYCRGGTYHCDHRLLCPNGVVKYVRLVGKVYLKGRGNGAVFEHGTVQDITERKLIEMHLRDNEEKLRDVLQSLPVAIVIMDAGEHGGLRYASEAAHALLGLPSNADLASLSLAGFWLSAEGLPQLLATLSDNEGATKADYLLRKTDGAMFWANVQAQVTRYAGNRAFLLCIQDISAQRAYLEELENRATRDPMTGVLNSHSMHEVAIKEFRRALRYNQPVSICVLSLDQLRSVSEGFGLTAAQELIRQFVDMLKDGVRVEDSVGRLGQDEFALLLVGASHEGAQLVAERIRKMCEEEYFEMQRQNFRFTLSAGVASMEIPGDKVEDVMARAMDGLHHARRMGANCVVTRLRQANDLQGRD